MLLFILCHTAANVLATKFFSEAGLGTIFWPASGIAVAAVLAGGLKYVPAVFVSCMIGGLINNRQWDLRMIFVLENTLETLLAWFLVFRVAKINIGLNRGRDYIKLILFVGILLPVPSAIIAATAIHNLTLSPLPFLYHMQTWWTGNSFGIILLTPLILVWRKMPEGWLNAKKLTEAAIGFALTILSGFIFLEGPPQLFGAYPRAFVAFAFVSWAAIRFGRRVTLVVTLIVVAQAIIGVHSTFSAGNNLNRPFDFANIWLFLVTLSTVGMALATTFNERETAAKKLSTLLEAYRREEKRRSHADSAYITSAIDFQRLVETAEEGVWTIDNQGLTTFANNRMARILGYTPAEMLRKSFLDFMPEADRPAGVDRLSQRNAGIREAHESALLHKEGHTVWTLMQTNPMTNIEGEITGALAMVTDITENKKTENALRESEERFRKIVESIRDAVIVHQSGFVIYANSAAVKLLGAADAASLVGLNAINFTHPDSRGAAVDRVQQLVNSEPDVKLPPFRRKVVRLDGRTITVESTATTITFNGRRAMVVIGHEVSDDADSTRRN